MTDNVSITAGSGTTIATDDVGGVQYQRVKMTWGVDGTATDVSATDPVPVSLADAPLAADAATETTIAAVLTKLSADPATQTTLAAVLAKIIAAPATEAKQDSQITQETATNTRLGEVQASPTANTVLDRLKALLTGIVLAAGSAIIGKVGIDQTTPGTTNGVQLTGDLAAGDYETVAASQTDQALGATGASGDYLQGVLIVPGTTAAGAVSIKDGAGSAISIFAGGGTTALITLIPFFVPLGIKSGSGAWKVTTGANVTAIGVGNFT